MNALLPAQHRADAAVPPASEGYALPPVPGETSLAYRKRLAGTSQPHSAEVQRHADVDSPGRGDIRADRGIDL